MKKLITSLMIVAGVSSALAQGSITFITANANTALGRTYMGDGTTLAGPAFWGQLWWSATEFGTFAPLDTPQSLAGGYVNDGGPPVPGRGAGEVTFFQMRVWDQAAGANWNTAVGNNPPTTASGLLTQYGTTATKSRTLGGINSDGDPVPPQQFNTFPNLTLTIVPEPSTIALAGLGLASLLIFRRRK